MGEFQESWSPFWYNLKFVQVSSRNWKSKVLSVLAENVFFLVHPSVTDPAKPDPVDYSSLPSENLASPVPSEYFDFTQLILCFPSDCAVRIENPNVFLKTNKPTKKNNKNKTTATAKVSLRSKRFRGVWEQRKTYGVFAARKMGREPKNERGG